jgi:hypothetical protein
MEELQNLENQLGFITFNINQAETMEERASLEDIYSSEIESIVNRIENLKQNNN